MKKTNKKETIYDGKTVIVMNSNIEDLEKELSQRIVRFWYTKKSGERRVPRSEGGVRILKRS